MRLATVGIVEPARGEVQRASVIGVEQVQVLPSARKKGESMGKHAGRREGRLEAIWKQIIGKKARHGK